MIHDLDTTIQNLLLANMPSKVEVKFDQPVKNWTQATRPILNLYLFDVRENNVLRAHQWQPAGAPPANGANRRHGKQRTPFRFDCHYLLTAWAEKISDQHRLLSEATAVLLQYPLIPTEYLAGTLHPDRFENPVEIPAHVGSHDKLTNPAELWSALDNQIRPAISYVVTIPLNPWDVELLSPPVRTKHLTLYDLRQPETAVFHTEIGGQISSETALPPDLYVTIANEQWQHRAEVDGDGRYRLRAINPGAYTLTAWLPTGPQAARKLGARPIVVPPTVRILALADTFKLQIGQDVTLDNLHLTPRRAGYVGQASLPGLAVQEVGSHMPRSGSYTFGRREDGSLTAEITAAGQPKVTSFQLVYQNPPANAGEYDLSIP